MSPYLTRGAPSAPLQLLIPMNAASPCAGSSSRRSALSRSCPKAFHRILPPMGAMVIQHLVMQGLKMKCLKTQSTCQTWHCSAFILAVFTMQSPVHLYFQQSEFNNDSAWRNPQLPPASREDLSLVVIPFSRLTNATPQDTPVWMQVSMHHPLNSILRLNFKILQTNPCHPPCDCSASPANLWTFCKFALQAKWINIWE